MMQIAYRERVKSAHTRIRRFVGQPVCARRQGAVMPDLKSLDQASPAEQARFFTVFESQIARDDGAVAKSHLTAGRPVHVSDPRYPGKVVRVHPDGRRELMALSTSGELVVERAL
ncbi:hypothetical protein ACPCHQ_22180 [Ralstonia thomasii]|uniref:hypothetical protein n=1 Tax=Ralstonia thomasii TaxID=3058596 RepID=UPI003C2F1EB2